MMPIDSTFPMQCIVKGTGNDLKKWYAVNPASVLPPRQEKYTVISVAFSRNAPIATFCNATSDCGFISVMKLIVCKAMVSPLVKKLSGEIFNHTSLGLTARFVCIP